MENTLNTLPISILTKNQKKHIIKHFKEDGKDCTLFINLKFDDECNNGRNSFAITGSLYQGGYEVVPKNEKYLVSCGAIHDEISKYAPELAYLIKWHSTSTDGPWGYIANTLYNASDLDCWGRSKGEPYNFARKLKFNNSPFLYSPSKELLNFIDLVGLSADWEDFKIVEIPHKNSKNKNEYQFSPKYSFNGMDTGEWHKAPFNNLQEANNFVAAMTNCKVEIVEEPTSWGEGKDRDFAAARNSAVWPEATDEQLSLPKEDLKKLLLARLPALMQNFKSDMEKLGFIY